MKKLLLALFLLASVSQLYAQEKRLNVYSAYVFDDSFQSNGSSSTNYYNGKLMGGYQWGLGAEFKINEGIGAELIYYRQDTKGTIYYNNVPIPRDLNVGVNYALIGINKYIPKDKVEPYAGLLLGAAIFSNKDPKPDEETSIVKFALGFRLGATIWASERVGIKLQAQFLSSVQGLGGGFYFGTGGAGAGATTYSTITQLTLGGGLAFKIGQ